MANIDIVRKVIKNNFPEELLDDINLSQLTFCAIDSMRSKESHFGSSFIYKTFNKERDVYFIFFLQRSQTPCSNRSFYILLDLIQIMKKHLSLRERAPLIFPYLMISKIGLLQTSHCVLSVEELKNFEESYYLKPFQLVLLGEIGEETLGKQHKEILKSAFHYDLQTGEEEIYYYFFKVVDIFKKCSSKNNGLDLQLVLEYVMLSLRPTFLKSTFIKRNEAKLKNTSQKATS